MTESPELPGALADVEAVAGREAAIALALAFGGESLHIPKPAHLGEGHPIVQTLGPDAARRVASHFTGESLYVPMARIALVHHLAGTGLSTRQIAKRLGIGTSTVSQYKRRAPVGMLT